MRGYRRRSTPKHRSLKLYLTTPGIPGRCRWCKGEIRDPKTRAILTRKTWHPECVGIYESQAHSDKLRKAILARDKGICAKCGIDCTDWKHFWQADHIVPLAAGGSFEHSNVQTLCDECHKAKSKADIQTIKAHRKGGGNPT